MYSLIIFPHQMYDPIFYPKDIDTVYLAEEPLFFCDKERSTTFNILKPFFHRCLFEEYKQQHSKNYKIKILYNDFYKNLPKIDFFFDPVDRILSERIKKYIPEAKMIDPPNFLINNYDDFISHNKKKNPRFTSFYTFYRKKLNILMDKNGYVGGKISFDTENRDSVPLNHEIIGELSFEHPNYEEIWKKTVKDFPSCIQLENYNDLSMFPLNKQEAQIGFDDFIENRLHLFGKYEDAIVKPEENKILYHSCISSSLNCGLITPLELLQELETVKLDKNILPAIEGFIRQLFWREFAKFIYIYREDLPSLNFFGAKGNLPPIFYYDLQDDSLDEIPVVKDYVISSWESGYCHHIIRLEVIGNYMLLCGIEPYQVYKWFLDFSLDAYDWVMVMNTYSMVCYADGDAPIFSKPYIVSSNYIEKMSNKRYKTSPLLTDLYRNFLEKHKNKNLGGRINKNVKSDGTGKKYIKKYIVQT